MGALTPEHRQKLSAAAIATWDRYYEQHDQPTHKRCPQCGETKRLLPREVSGFYWRKRHRADGRIHDIPAAECKACAQARVKRTRKAKTLEQRRADKRRWDASRDPKRVRRYNREYGRMRRMKAGAKQSKTRIPAPAVRLGTVPAASVVAYLQRFITRRPIAKPANVHRSPREFQDALFLNGKRMTENHIRSFNAWKNGEYQAVEVVTLDAWATEYDLPFWELEQLADAA